MDFKIVASTAAGVVLLLGTLLLLVRRRGPELKADFAKGSTDAWRKTNGSQAGGKILNSAYQLGPMEGVLSRESMPAEPGAVYVLEYRASVIKDPTKPGRDTFHAGPVFLDSSGKVVGWWKEQPAMRRRHGRRKRIVEIAAPPAAATVHMGIHGSWAQDGAPGDLIVAFSDIRLRKDTKRKPA